MVKTNVMSVQKKNPSVQHETPPKSISKRTDCKKCDDVIKCPCIAHETHFIE